MADREQITVTYGPEVFWPTRSSGFTVGPFTYTTSVLISETPKEAFQRAHKMLDSIADKAFTKQRNAYFERLGTVITKKKAE